MNESQKLQELRITVMSIYTQGQCEINKQTNKHKKKQQKSGDLCKAKTN